MVGSNITSKYRKKRKRFTGHRKQENNKEEDGENRDESRTFEVGPSTSTPDKHRRK